MRSYQKKDISVCWDKWLVQLHIVKVGCGSLWTYETPWPWVAVSLCGLHSTTCLSMVQSWVWVSGGGGGRRGAAEPCPHHGWWLVISRETLDDGDDVAHICRSTSQPACCHTGNYMWMCCWVCEWVYLTILVCVCKCICLCVYLPILVCVYVCLYVFDNISVCVCIWLY